MLDNISLFIKLYEVKSFKKCSELVNVSPSTISKHIADLEYKLGKQLIIRTTKTFEPTPYGTYIYNNLRNIPVFTESVIKSYNIKQKNKNKGQLNITLGTSISYELISPYLDDFINLHPNVCLNIMFKSNVLTWPSEDTSIVLSGDPIKDPKFDSRFIRTEYANLFCSKNYVDKYGLPEKPEELINHRVISILNPRIPNNHVIMHNSKNQATFILDLSNVKIKTNDGLHMKKIGMRCNYIFNSCYSLVLEEIRQGDIIPVLPDWYTFEINFHIITKKTINSLEKSFINFLYDSMNNSYNKFIANSIYISNI